ncbi:hypothetical protein JCM16303_000503 [Sporobolomyces ruberrimus]
MPSKKSNDVGQPTSGDLPALLTPGLLPFKNQITPLNKLPKDWCQPTATEYQAFKVVDQFFDQFNRASLTNDQTDRTVAVYPVLVLRYALHHEEPFNSRHLQLYNQFTTLLYTQIYGKESYNEVTGLGHSVTSVNRQLVYFRVYSQEEDCDGPFGPLTRREVKEAKKETKAFLLASKLTILAKEQASAIKKVCHLMAYMAGQTLEEWCEEYKCKCFYDVGVGKKANARYGMLGMSQEGFPMEKVASVLAGQAQEDECTLLFRMTWFYLLSTQRYTKEYSTFKSAICKWNHPLSSRNICPTRPWGPADNKLLLKILLYLCERGDDTHPVAVATLMFALRAVNNKGELVMPVEGAEARLYDFIGYRLNTKYGYYALMLLENGIPLEKVLRPKIIQNLASFGINNDTSLAKARRRLEACAPKTMDLGGDSGDEEEEEDENDNDDDSNSGDDSDDEDNPAPTKRPKYK